MEEKTVQKQNRREEIKQKAAYMFRKRGFQATSMREIADAVGIKAASIYNHISSKQELLEEMLLTLAHTFVEGMDYVLLKGNNTTIDKLEALIDLHVNLTVEHTDEIALIVGEWVHLEEEAKQKYLHLRDEYEQKFKSILEDGKCSGTIKDIDTDIMLFSILSTLRWLYSWYSKNRDCNIGVLKAQLTKCLVLGVVN